jgi:hypothetical protein
MQSVGFEPAISAIERLQTYALDRTVTAIDSVVSLPNDEWIPAYTLRNSLRWSEKIRESGAFFLNILRYGFVQVKPFIPY